jgi:D-glucuronyl C5-epimerase-like protein
VSRGDRSIGGRAYHRLVKAILSCAAVVLIVPVGARADRVLVLHRDGVRAEEQPGIGPAWPRPAARARRSRPGFWARAAARPSVPSELARLRRAGALGALAYASHRREWSAALRTLGGLRGRRRAELAAVVANTREVAARHLLRASRVRLVFLTLARNRDWWSRGSLLSYGQRVGFAGSALVWEAYPGQGIQLHPLGTWGKGNALWSSHHDTELAGLVEEMRAVAVRRAGGIAWEYVFHFGVSPVVWASGLAQATGAQVLARAAERLDQPTYAADAKRALGIFTHAPPVGVRLQMRRGPHYLMYSWAPGLWIINGFVQAVVALHDVAELTGSPVARRLYVEGEREARREVPRYDTGAWSMYDQNHESDLGYHVLLRDFLRNLCDRSGRAVYCDTAERFTAYLREPPRISGITRRARAGARGLVRFRLSKRSQVVVEVRRGARLVWRGRSPASFGPHGWPWRAPGPGTYTVAVFATDMAGNAATRSATLVVRRG